MFGVVLDPRPMANQVQFSENDILTFGKSTRHASLEQKMQTKKPLRWDIRSLKRNKLRGNNSFRDGQNKSSCCKNKELKKTKKYNNTHQKNRNIRLNTRLRQATKQRSLYHNKDDLYPVLLKDKSNQVLPMYPYVNGEYLFFLFSCNYIIKLLFSFNWVYSI